MRFFNFSLFFLSVFILAFLAPGIDLVPALIIAIVLGIINSLIKPLFYWLHFPTNPLTLSLATFVVMGLLSIIIIRFIPIQQSTAEGHIFYSYGNAENFPIWLIFIFALVLAGVNFLIQHFSSKARTEL